ncbi:MAG: InlB B-repeat-containing protein, partial [Oscillospiraceae bacterium]
DDNSAYTVFFGYSEVSKVKLTFDNNTEEVTTPQDTTWNDVTANLPIKNQPLESQKTLPTMTRAHYTFNGWALDKEGKTAFTTESSIDKDTTVYAQWTEHSSSNAAVRYDANNAEYTGSVPTDNNKYYLEDDVTVSAEKLSGVTNYTFKGWSTDKSATTPMTETSVKMANLTTGVTFYGVWEQNKVNVKFDANGGDAYTQPTGYDNLKAGLSLKGNQKELPNTNPTKANSQFIGWTMDKAGNVPFNVDTVLNDNGATDKTITVYAKYADVYTVKYDVNAPKGVTVNGNPTDGNNYLANAEVTLTTVPLTTAHYKFTGWSYDQAGTDLLNSKDGKFNLPANKAKNGVVTLYAVWQEDGKYPVTYNVNPPKGVTVTGTAPTEVPQYAGEYQVKSSELTAKGYIFKGYALTQNATIAYEKVEIVAPGITLYGVWEKNDKEQIHYTVEYYKNSLEAPETFTKVGDTESGGFWVGDSKTVEQAIKTNSLAPEYRQESIEVNGKKDIGMSFPITIDGTVIKVYNVLDQAPYTINYYTDDINKPVVVTGGKELIGKEVNANANDISVKLPGYKFADNQITSMKLQAELGAEPKNNVLNIKCVQKEVKLTINYFKDGVQDTNAT